MVFYLILYSLLVLGNSVNSFIFPKISEPTTARTYYVDEDKNFSLTCRAEGRPTYQWIRDGKVLPENETMGKNVITVDSRYGNLTIEVYSSRFDGEYTCLATIRNVTIMSQPQTLLQVVIKPFEKTNLVEVVVNEYSHARLEIGQKGQVVAPPDQNNYHWLLQPSTKYVDMRDGRKFVDNSGNLHFAFVKNNDEHLYQCSFMKNDYEYGILGNRVDVTIKMIKAPKQILPQFRYGNSGVRGIVEASARLECFFSGYDPQADFSIPTIKWFNDGNEIINDTKYHLLQWNRVLVITDLKKEDEKEYFCQGFTSGGRSDKHVIFLNVTSKPIWVAAPESKTIAVNEDAVFNCNAGSLPNENVSDPPEWYINGKKMSDLVYVSRKYHLSNDKKTLTVKNVGKDDIQCVQCIVKNSVGSVMENACLDIVTISAGLNKDENETAEVTVFQLFIVSAILIVCTIALIFSVLHFRNKSRVTETPPTVYKDTSDGGNPVQDQAGDDQDITDD